MSETEEQIDGIIFQVLANYMSLPLGSKNLLGYIYKADLLSAAL